MQNVGRAPDRAYQSAVHAAQDEESKDSLMQEHAMRMPGVGKGKEADLGFCQDGSRTNKRGELSGIVALGKRPGLLNSPL